MKKLSDSGQFTAIEVELSEGEHYFAWSFIPMSFKGMSIPHLTIFLRNGLTVRGVLFLMTGPVINTTSLHPLEFGTVHEAKKEIIGYHNCGLEQDGVVQVTMKESKVRFYEEEQDVGEFFSDITKELFEYGIGGGTSEGIEEWRNSQMERDSSSSGNSEP